MGSVRKVGENIGKGTLGILSALNGFGTPGIGGKYDKNDAAKDTRSSSSQVSSAWHTARDDAAGSDGVPADRHK